MPIFCPPELAATPEAPGRHVRKPTTVRRNACVGFVIALCLSCASPGHTQTLAQRDWAGSGVSIQRWWPRGIFYRIDPARFQDSTGTGVGDIAGIAQRMEYIQALGVDAILLQPAPGDPPITPNAAGIDDVARSAVDHHLRLVVALPAPDSQAAAADQQLLGLARAWFTQGVAGLYIPTPAFAKVDGAAHVADLLHQLHALAASFPGERILLAEAPPPGAEDALTHALQQNVQLTASPSIRVAQGAGQSAAVAASLRAQLSADLGSVNPLLVADRVQAQSSPEVQAGLDRSVAAILLASRAAVILDYGQELGILPSTTAPPLMQWTPVNHTLKPAPQKVVAEQGPPPSTAFHPFVPPLPRNFFPPPPMPEVFPTDHPVNVVPLTPNEMPGFTNGDATLLQAVNAATANAAIEGADPESLENFYRHLIQMHHDSATLRDGAQTFLDQDAEGAVVWLRQPPAGRSGGTNIVACNLSQRPLVLSPDALHLHAAAFRTLLGTVRREGANIILAPDTVFLGEPAR
jgi:hypothetical protein